MQNFSAESNRTQTEFWKRTSQAWGPQVAGCLHTLCGCEFSVNDATTSEAGQAPSGMLWLPLEVEEGGPLVLCIARPDALRLLALLAAGAVEGDDAELDDVQRAVLREALVQVGMTLDGAIDSGRSRAPLTCGNLRDDAIDAAVSGGVRCDLRLTASGNDSLTLTLLVPVAAAARLAPPESPLAALFPPVLPRPSRPAGQNLGVLLDVTLKLMVVLGQSRVPLKELLAIGPGSLLELDSRPGDPLEILVNGKVFGHGEVVVVDDRIGIRVLDVVDDGDRQERAG